MVDRSKSYMQANDEHSWNSGVHIVSNDRQIRQSLDVSRVENLSLDVVSQIGGSEGMLNLRSMHHSADPDS